MAQPRVGLCWSRKCSLKCAVHTGLGTSGILSCFPWKNFITLTPPGLCWPQPYREAAVLPTGQILGIQGMEGPRGCNWDHPTVARDAWDLLRSCPGNQGTPRKPPGTHSTHTNTPIMAVDPPLLAKLPMSQPLALEGIQERWWQAWTQTNSWAGLSIMALIVPLMQAGKVTSPLCATPPCCFCFVFYLFLSL